MQYTIPPNDTIAAEKKQLRAHIRHTLSQIPPADLAQQDDMMFARFLALEQVEKADTIFLFWGSDGIEPCTEKLFAPLWEMGKTLCLPRVLPNRQMAAHLYKKGDKVISSKFGVIEPLESAEVVEKDKINLALVPSMCYDAKGFRLGFGGGYYDRWLCTFTGDTVGLCRDAILQPCVPTNEFDRSVSLVLTESKIFTFA